MYREIYTAEILTCRGCRVNARMSVMGRRTARSTAQTARVCPMSFMSAGRMSRKEGKRRVESATRMMLEAKRQPLFVPACP
ncbi:hypothetical protein DFH06DRAFT_1295376 [Mycena polygramma]|nr:hypothetical protein DFH06DRAFT_1295376 [Mycena polygramma]